ncbi:MAG: sialidase family protein [Verrucomicrobia bacterium]|nr:sialidase family protein [Verrucomicrobiota bacterium]
MRILARTEAQRLVLWRGRFLRVITSLMLAASNWLPSLVAGQAVDAAPPPTVNVVQAPAQCLVPDVFMDAKGLLHMVYGLAHDAYYVYSADNGATFSAPVKVNSTGMVETKMGERGPKLAVGSEGCIHVVWVDEWAPGVRTFVRYSRSLDGGKSFEPLKTVSATSGVDGVTLTADAKGNVLAFWHVMVDPKPEVKAATWLHTACSTDNGASFGPTEKVRLNNLSGLACSMCMMRARIGPDGYVYLAFRSAEASIRDFYVLKGRPAENRFTALRVNQDNWEIDYCPMCGPELTFTPSGKSLCAFMTRKRVYWAVGEAETSGYRLHVATPSSEEEEIYPSAIANRKGAVLFVWQVGRMAVEGTATVKWALYDEDGIPTGKAGILGKSFAGTKATAFVGKDDNFYIVTTARKVNAP